MTASTSSSTDMPITIRVSILTLPLCGNRTFDLMSDYLTRWDLSDAREPLAC